MPCTVDRFNSTDNPTSHLAETSVQNQHAQNPIQLPKILGPLRKTTSDTKSQIQTSPDILTLTLKLAQANRL